MNNIKDEKIISISFSKCNLSTFTYNYVVHKSAFLKQLKEFTFSPQKIKISFFSQLSERFLKGQYPRISVYERRLTVNTVTKNVSSIQISSSILCDTLTCVAYCFYFCTGFPNCIVGPMERYLHHLLRIPPSLYMVI